MCWSIFFVQDTLRTAEVLSLDLVLSLRVNEHGPPTIDLNEQQTFMLAVLFTVPDCFSGLIIIQFILGPKLRG